MVPAAQASTGDPGSGALIQTSRPDLTSIAVADGSVYAVLAQAIYCFDETIDPDYVNGTGFLLYTHDAGRYLRSVSASANPDRLCVTATFHPTVDLLTELSIGAVDGGAVVEPGDVNQNVPASARVENSQLAPVARRTTGPDLVAATANPADNTADFTFDQPIDPGVAQVAAQQFAMADAAGTERSANGAAVSANRRSVHVQFPPGTSVAAAIRFFVRPDAVRTYPQDGTLPGAPVSTPYTANPDGVVVVSPQPDRPELVAATTTGDPNRLLLTYSADPGALNPADVTAVLDNATTLGGNAVSEVAGVRRQRIVSFGSVPVQAESVVSVVSHTGAAATGGNLPGPAGIADVAKIVGSRGHTNAPDLNGITVDATTSVATFAFDEAVSSASPSDVSRFMVVFGDGTTRTGDAIVGVTGNQVRIHVPGAIGGAVGGAILPTAVRDVPGTPNVPSSVSTALIPEPTKCPPVCPVATTTISVKRKGSRLIGTLNSDVPACRTGRRVTLLRRGRAVRSTVGRTPTIALALPKKTGSVQLRVDAVTVPGWTCSAATSRPYTVTAKLLRSLKKKRRG